MGCEQALLARDTTKTYEMAAEARQCALNYTFSFAYVWTLGGNLKVDMRPKFDSFARAQLKAVLGNLPSSGTVSCEATSYTCSSTMPTTRWIAWNVVTGCLLAMTMPTHYERQCGTSNVSGKSAPCRCTIILWSLVRAARSASADGQNLFRRSQPYQRKHPLISWSPPLTLSASPSC